jgi:hypothetical protein
MRMLTCLSMLLWVIPAQALILDVQITPADGLVNVGQDVAMVLTATNDSSVPFTGMIAANIAGLNLPVVVSPCVVSSAIVSPPPLPPLPFSYLMSWHLDNVPANATRRCEATFRVQSLPNGVVTIAFRNGTSTLATVSFRAKPLVAAPAMTALGAGLLALLLLAVAIGNYRQ